MFRKFSKGTSFQSDQTDFPLIFLTNPDLLVSLPIAEIHSDSMSLVRCVRSVLAKNLPRRRRLDVADLKDSITRSELRGVFHIAGPSNPSDPLTKFLTRCSDTLPFLRQVCGEGH